MQRHSIEWVKSLLENDVHTGVGNLFIVTSTLPIRKVNTRATFTGSGRTDYQYSRNRFLLVR